MPDNGGRRNDHTAPGGIDPPAEIDVVAEHRPGPIEPAESVPDLAPDEHAGSANCQHVADVVVLTLVELTRLETRLAMPGRVDRESDLNKSPAVPAGDFRPDDTRR